jgi:NAD(P)-dependent dehydrogenase (short-subunit alcohol dehydrogenase family)
MTGQLQGRSFQIVTFAGQPEEIGSLAVFLASRASSFITGQTVFIDGGYTCW